MATGINLLPEGKVLKGRDRVLVEGISKIVFGGLIVFIVAALAIAGYFVYSSLRMRASLSSEEALKVQIEALSDTEQSFFLIKDRVSKVRTVLAKESLNDEMAKLSGFLVNLPGDARLIEVQATNQKITIGISFISSSSFGSFYKNLVSSGKYKTIILKSLSFSPSGGYVAALELIDE